MFNQYARCLHLLELASKLPPDSLAGKTVDLWFREAAEPAQLAALKRELGIARGFWSNVHAIERMLEIVQYIHLVIPGSGMRPHMGQHMDWADLQVRVPRIELTDRAQLP